MSNPHASKLPRHMEIGGRHPARASSEGFAAITDMISDKVADPDEIIIPNSRPYGKNYIRLGIPSARVIGQNGVLHSQNVRENMILVTGAAGLIGRHICACLDNAGIEYRPLDLKRSASEDIRDREDMANALKGVRGVLHLAAVSRVIWGERDPRCYAR
jgi:hypothetical protein